MFAVDDAESSQAKRIDLLLLLAEGEYRLLHIHQSHLCRGGGSTSGCGRVNNGGGRVGGGVSSGAVATAAASNRS